MFAPRPRSVPEPHRRLFRPTTPRTRRRVGPFRGWPPPVHARRGPTPRDRMISVPWRGLCGMGWQQARKWGVLGSYHHGRAPYAPSVRTFLQIPRAGLGEPRAQAGPPLLPKAELALDHFEIGAVVHLLPRRDNLFCVFTHNVSKLVGAIGGCVVDHLGHGFRL